MKKVLKICVFVDILLIISLVYCFSVIREATQKEKFLLQRNDVLLNEFINKTDLQKEKERLEKEIEKRFKKREEEIEKNKSYDEYIMYKYSKYNRPYKLKGQTKEDLAMEILREQEINGEPVWEFYNEINNNIKEINKSNKRKERIGSKAEYLAVSIICLSLVMIVLYQFKLIRKILIYIISYIIFAFVFAIESIDNFISDISEQVKKINKQ